MSYLNRDGFRLQYIQKGDRTKPPIMVIGSAVYYLRLFENNIFKKLNLIFIDHRGFSIAENANASYLLDDVVEDIEAIRRQLGIDELYLLGHSGHGFMAMAYAKKYEQHVLGLILSNLAPNNTQERQDGSIQYFEETASAERKTYFYQEIAKLDAVIKNDPANRFSHMNIHMQAHSFYDFTFDGAYLWEGVHNNMPALDYLWGEAFAIFDTTEFLKQWKKPTLLLLSEFDYLVAPTDLWQTIVETNQIAVIKFERSGHNPMLEEPKAYFEVLQKFIR